MINNLLKQIFIALLCSVPLVAQVEVAGVVTDMQTQNPLDDVRILTQEGKTLAVTGDDGKFNVELAGAGVKILFKRTGYKTIVADIRTGISNLTIQMQPGILFTEEINVTGFNTDRDLYETPGSVGLLTERDFARSNGTSLSAPLNMLSGVRMELKNSLSTSRIIIRGVGARSNFDTRNVKIYWNDIPLTDAGGYSSINGVDAGILDRVEVLKGPSSSIYGANIAGVLNMRTERGAFNDKEIKAYGVTGAYGLSRYGTSFKTGSNTSSIYFAYNRQDYEGYREHSRDTKNFLTFAGQFYPSKNNMLTVFGNYTANDFLIAGPLDSIQFRGNPQAADTNYINKKAAYRSDEFRGGISNMLAISSTLTNTTTVYAGSVQDENPLTYAYIRSNDISFGGRSTFEQSLKVARREVKFIGGGEVMFNKKSQQNYANISGEAGEISSDKNYDLMQMNLFLQSNISFTEKFFVTLGAGVNKTRYDIEDLLKAKGIDETGVKEFDMRVSPRAALYYSLSPGLSLHSSISYGFSPPALSEVYRPDATINTDIDAEKGVNYEAGVRGILFNGQFFYDAAVFSMDLTGEILPRSSGPNQFVYVNSGKTRHKGLELSASYTRVFNRGMVTAINLYTTYSYNDFKFTEYVVEGIDYAGNELPGTAKHYFNAGMDINTEFGGYAFITYNYTGRIPVTDDNSVYSEPYSLLNTRLGVNFHIFEKVMLDVSLGAENILDEKYSAFLMLNQKPTAPGRLPKFYNPSPERSIYGRLGVNYSL